MKKRTRWATETLNLLKKYKLQGLTNKQIANKLKVKVSSVNNACTKYNVLLNKKMRKQRYKEAGKKGNINRRKRLKAVARISKFDEDLGYIVGVLFGDGSAVDLGNRGYLELRTTNKSFAMAFSNALLNYTNIKPKYYTRICNKTLNGRAYKNVKFYEIFYYKLFFTKNIIKLFGKTTTKDWKINVPKIKSYGTPFCKGMIRGLFDSEGTFWIGQRKTTNYGSLEFSTTNKKGAKSLHKLLTSMGFAVNFNTFNRKNGVIEYKIRSKKLSTIRKFCEEIGFNVDCKQQKLQTFITSRLKT